MQCQHEGCRSQFATVDQGSPKYGYCFRHAQERGLITKEEKEIFEEKRAKAIAESWKSGTYGTGRLTKKERKKQGLEPKVVKLDERALREKQKKEAEEAKALLHKILGDENFNAAVMIAGMNDVGADFKMNQQMKKFIFISWFLSDPKTRKPDVLSELCVLLKMEYAEGRRWLESDWFISDLQVAMQKSMKLAMPYIARLTLAKAIGGDFNALKEFVKIFGKHESKEGEEDWAELFSEEILHEAEQQEN